MLRGSVAFRPGRAHQEPRRAVRPVQLSGRVVPEEARPTAKEPRDRGVERLRGRLDGRLAAGHIHQLQVAQAVAIAVGRTGGSADTDHAGKSTRGVIEFSGPFIKCSDSQNWVLHLYCDS